MSDMRQTLLQIVNDMNKHLDNIIAFDVSIKIEADDVEKLLVAYLEEKYGNNWVTLASFRHVLRIWSQDEEVKNAIVKYGTYMGDSDAYVFETHPSRTIMSAVACWNQISLDEGQKTTLDRINALTWLTISREEKISTVLDENLATSLDLAALPIISRLKHEHCQLVNVKDGFEPDVAFHVKILLPQCFDKQNEEENIDFFGLANMQKQIDKMTSDLNLYHQELARRHEELDRRVGNLEFRFPAMRAALEHVHVYQQTKGGHTTTL